jgi:hypothetical protein
MFNPTILVAALHANTKITAIQNSKDHEVFWAIEPGKSSSMKFDKCCQLSKSRSLSKPKYLEKRLHGFLAAARCADKTDRLAPRRYEIKLLSSMAATPSR